MNNGKICIAVCAETAGEFLEKVEIARPIADLVELRFDCLQAEQVRGVRERISGDIFITTFRSPEQGGVRCLTLEERKQFWRDGFESAMVDIEEDLVEDIATLRRSVRICSFHDFNGVPSDIEEIFKRLSATDADIQKIAIKANDAVDAIPIWRLFELARTGDKEIIPIAMGEAGKWTRILGLAHGAYLTYASLGTGDETAPGQITARDMIDVYRVKELDEQTEVYGIIAGDTSYTMSPYIHNAAFKTAGLNAVFVPFQATDLDAFMTRMVQPKTREVELNFRGFSVTNPHKRSIIRYLDEIDDAAKKIGAVNTIKITDGKLHGHNTDTEGFIKPLIAKFPDLNRANVAVIGAGGAARACVYALLQQSAAVTVYARDRKKASELVDSFELDNKQLTADSYQPSADFSSFDIVVNTTPLGTDGHLLRESIAMADQLKGVRLVYDLIYNPRDAVLREANAAGAGTLGGFDMLLSQAANQFEIWTGQDAPVEAMAAAARKKLNDG
jgi:shikimate 5-dehydrogenase